MRQDNNIIKEKVIILLTNIGFTKDIDHIESYNFYNNGNHYQFQLGEHVVNIRINSGINHVHMKDGLEYLKEEFVYILRRKKLNNLLNINNS